MKSGTIDTDSFKVESRQPIHRRKISKNCSTFNGADESGLDYAVEDRSVVRQVNLVAAYHDHISCTKSVDFTRFDSGREIREDLPCETDHIYAHCSDIINKAHCTNAISNDTQDLSVENVNLRDMLLSHLDVISHLQEELESKNKQISKCLKETEKLRLRLERREQRMCLLRKSYPDIERTESAMEQPHSDQAEMQSSNRHPVLATRYFGRRSKTVPSRALKRRYMGPPKNFLAKQVVLKAESSATSVSSISEALEVERGTHSSALKLYETQEADIVPNVKSRHKKIDRKPKMLTRKLDFLTTDEVYFLPPVTTKMLLPEPLCSKLEIDVPLWKIKPVSSFYQMEGTENINDPVFDRRHQKHEQDERRRKRWDVQRLREQRGSKKLKQKYSRSGDNASPWIISSFYPEPGQVEFIEVTEQLPVLAFGHVIPLFQPCEFSLPWQTSDTNKGKKVT